MSGNCRKGRLLRWRLFWIDKRRQLADGGIAFFMLRYLVGEVEHCGHDLSVKPSHFLCWQRGDFTGQETALLSLVHEKIIATKTRALIPL